jgi:hypothetical protein
MKIQKIILVIILLVVISCEEQPTNTNSDEFNNPPEIVEFILSLDSPFELSNYNNVLIQVVAIDRDGDDLTYSWESSRGRFVSPVGMPEMDQLFAFDSIGIYVVKCSVSDGNSIIEDSINIEVIDNSITLPESNLNFTEHIQPLFRLRCGNVKGGCHSFTNIGGPPAGGLELISYQNIMSHLIKFK